MLGKLYDSMWDLFYKHEKISVAIVTLVGLLVDIATWYVAFTNGWLVFWVIMANRIAMGKILYESGYTQVAFDVIEEVYFE